MTYSLLALLGGYTVQHLHNRVQHRMQEQQETIERQKRHIHELEEELLRLRREMRICALYDTHFTETDIASK